MPSIGSINQKFFKFLFDLLIEVPDYFSDSFKKKYELINLDQAIRNIHFPENAQILVKAQKRLKFEEFFFLQLHLLKIKITK